MKRVIFMSLVAMFTLATALVAKEKITKTAAFKVHLHCDDCVRKIEGAIPFERGVKNLFVNKDTHVVTVVFNPEKTDSTAIAAAFKKIDFEVE